MELKCALCGKRSNSWICGINGMFLSCNRCNTGRIVNGKKTAGFPYDKWKHLLGELKEQENYYKYCTKHLRLWLHYQNWLYYKEDNPAISDIEYDKALRELQFREETEDIVSDSPTQTVGCPLSEKPDLSVIKECRSCK